MVNIIPQPLWTIEDDDGIVIVGASVYTYVPGTLTLKPTYQGPDTSSAQNLNPIITDGAGRTPAMWGTGDFRIIVKDNQDVLLWDQVTRTGLPESAVSAVMLPVIGAPTLAEARRLMGIDDAVQAMITAAVNNALATEAAARAAADVNLQNQITANLNYLNAQVAALNTSITNLANNIQAQINAIVGDVAALQAGSTGGNLSLQTGTGTTDADGNLIQNYTPFPHALHEMTMTTTDPSAEPFDNISYFTPNWYSFGLGIFVPSVQTNGQSVGSLVYNDPDTSTMTTLRNTTYIWTAIGY